MSRCTEHLVRREGTVITRADDLTAEPGDADHRSERKKAEEFLREILADGPMPPKELEAAAEAQSISMRTLERAGKKLGVFRR